MIDRTAVIAPPGAPTPTSSGTARHRLRALWCRRRTREHDAGVPVHRSAWCRYVETDVQVTADGALVAFHDNDLRRTCGRAGRISDLPWREVRTAMVDGAAPIPLLEDLLGTWPELRVNIDCKSTAAVDALEAALLRCTALDRVCVGAFSDTRMRTLKQRLGERLCTALAPGGVVALRFGRPRRAVADAAQVPVSQGRITVVNAPFVARAHALGIKVHVWTIDGFAELHCLLDLGVDGIMTDRPSRFARCSNNEVSGNDVNGSRPLPHHPFATTHGCQCRWVGHPGRALDPGPGRQRSGCRHRHQRGHRRHRPAPVRHGWRPARTGPPQAVWNAPTRCQWLFALGRWRLGSRCSQRAFGDAVPARRTHRHRARLRRRLGSTPRALQHAARWQRCSPAGRAGRGRLPRQPVARQLPDPRRPAGPRDPAAARRAGAPPQRSCSPARYSGCTACHRRRRSGRVLRGRLRSRPAAAGRRLVHRSRTWPEARPTG